MIGGDFPPTGVRNERSRTGPRCRDFHRCQVSGATKIAGDFESDSEFLNFRDRDSGERGVGFGWFRYLKIGLFVGNGSWIKWIKLRRASVKLTQRYLTASGGEVWARSAPGTEET